MHGLYGVADRTGLHALHVTAKSPNKPLEVDLKINGRDMSMELDTGAATSVVSEKNVPEFVARCSPTADVNEIM